MRVYSSVIVAWMFVSIYVPVSLAEEYVLGPDSMVQDGVPVGTVTKYEWNTSQVYAGTHRDYWVYVPAQYDGSDAACVMVFQDGWRYQDSTGGTRVPVVFDNLIHRGEMPVTIGIFINPGVFPVEGGKPKSNRSVEYDTLSNAYSRFLLEEILPEVGKKYRLVDTPAGRAIGGISSGGICAFTVAWERPDTFSKVISHVGSFTNIRGGYVYPSKIRLEEKRDIRVFLQAGENDLNNKWGSWPLGNLQMESALGFRDYDYKFVMGTEGHNDKHGGTILPEMIRWIWRDHPGVKANN